MKANRLAACLAVCAAFGFGLLWGCGQSSSPTDSNADASLALAKPAWKTEGATATSSSASTEESSTTNPVQTKTASGWFSPEDGGSLSVKFKSNYGSWTDVRLKSASFEVSPGAMDAGADITMEVTSGYTIDDVCVTFGPSGLTFNPEGTLTLTFWGGSTLSEEELRLREATGYHITSDGYISEVIPETETQGNAYFIVILKVPGFSRYSLGGDR